MRPLEKFSMPSPEQMRDAANREGYYESAYYLLGKELSACLKDLWKTREALAAALERVSELEGHVGDWRSLAFKYGTRTEAEKRRDTMTLNGTVTIARELVMQGNEAITHACVRLAKKLCAIAKEQTK